MHFRTLTVSFVAAFLGLGLLLSGGCTALEPLASPFSPPTPRERYASNLQAVELDVTTLGQAWLRAGDEAVSSPVDAEAPLREVLYFDPARPEAAGFRLALRQGQRLEIRLRALQEAPLPFVELLQPPAAVGEEPENLSLEALDLQPAVRVASGEAPGGEDSIQGQRGTWQHEPGEDGPVILRLQPELLSGGAFELEARVLGTLSFPVEGKNRSAVGSVFGDPRDGGRRSHEGVDIFADRGTPAVAAGDGVVSRVGTNRLGGNVVWLRTGGLTLYYAHLDEATVSFGQRLATGEEVGKVGNTGNARHTPPHLHFGVYDGGARDPLRFLDPLKTEPAAVTAPVERLSRWARVSGARVRLRQGPSTRTDILTELPRHTALRLHGARDSWYRVSLPDGTHGYIAASLTEPAERPVRQERLGEARLLRSRPQPAGLVVGTVESNTAVPVLASYEEHLLVETPDGHAAWLGEVAPELNLASAS